MTGVGFTIANDEIRAGITVVLDRLSGLVREEFEESAKYVDVVQLGWGLPLVWSEEGVRSRIGYYQKQGIKVAMSGTAIEYATTRGEVESMLDRAEKLRFDMVEVSDGIIEMPLAEKQNLAKKVKSRGFEVIYTVGKKDPSGQLSTPEVISEIEAGLSLDPFKVMIESRERGRGVGIYDADGNVRWPLLRAITSAFDHRELVFEAPAEPQQTALILELGPEVNLAHIALGSIATLQAERMGLKFDTFGVDKPREDLRGGPSTKFVLFAVRNYQPIDQKGIAAITQLPRRTIQKALEDLVQHKLITEHPSFEDRRSKTYRTTSSWPIEKFR